MFGDNNQSQKPDDNNDQNGQVNAPVDPSNPNHVSAFNMDNPAAPGPALTPSKSAAVEPPAPPPPLPDINSEQKADDNLPLTLPTPKPSDNSKPKDEEPADSSNSDDDEDKPKDSPPADDNLLKIKQQALGQLTPMLAHLDQSPEEKFRTYMMMIQANDDQSLINDAYKAAQQITDEKAKAHALLDVVNEINYFTQNDNNDD